MTRSHLVGSILYSTVGSIDSVELKTAAELPLTELGISLLSGTDSSLHSLSCEYIDLPTTNGSLQRCQVCAEARAQPEEARGEGEARLKHQVDAGRHDHQVRHLHDPLLGYALRDHINILPGYDSPGKASQANSLCSFVSPPTPASPQSPGALVWAS